MYLDSQHPDPKVSVIVLNWNTPGHTVDCLEKVRACTELPHEVILVDNGSTDGSVGKFCDLVLLWDTLIRLPKNVGFAAGVNRGLRAIHPKSEYVCLLNSDAFVTEGAIEEMVAVLEANHQLGLVGPRGKTVLNPPEQRGEPGVDYEDVITDKTLAFFCVVIPTPVVDQIGLLDERFGLGTWEDGDYCKRLKDAGYTLGIAGKAFVFHEVNATFRANNLDVQSICNENQGKYIEKWGSV